MTDPEPFPVPLIRQHDWLAPVLAEHLADHDGVLGHVLMADVTRALVREHQRPDERSQARVRAVLGALESAFLAAQPGDQTKGVIALSFVFNLPAPDEPGADLRNRLGPALAEEFKRQGW